MLVALLTIAVMTLLRFTRLPLKLPIAGESLTPSLLPVGERVPILAATILALLVPVIAAPVEVAVTRLNIHIVSADGHKSMTFEDIHKATLIVLNDGDNFTILKSRYTGRGQTLNRAEFKDFLVSYIDLRP
jgi:hypothetical protein